jgi:hypothetical protein
LELFEKNATDATLTDQELNASLPRFYLSIGHDGLLQYGKATPWITAVVGSQEVQGGKTSQGNI